MSAPINVKVLIVAVSADAGKGVAHAVTKAGFNTKGKFAVNLEVLEAELQKQPWDFVLAAEELPESIGLAQIVAITNEHQAHTPVVVVSQSVNDEIRYEALTAGAKDAVSTQNLKLLGLVLRPAKSEASSNASEVMEDEFAVVTEGGKQTDGLKKGASAAVAVVEPLSEEEELWSVRIHKALENNRFVCVYQPIVNLNAEPAANYEILLRMLDDDGSEIPPGAFLGVAEKTRCMGDIDRWVILHAIKTIKIKLKEDPSTRFFIKLSTQTLQDGKLIRWLSEQLHDAKLPMHRFVFEITAEAASRNEQRVVTLVSAIKMNNCMICLDRVSDTESHKRLAADLGVNYLKLSGQLIHELSVNRDNQYAVDSVSRYAKENKIQTIAQFVQDASSLAFLWQKGINYIQGYYLQRPDAALSYKFAIEEAECEAPPH